MGRSKCNVLEIKKMWNLQKQHRVICMHAVCHTCLLFLFNSFWHGWVFDMCNLAYKIVPFSYLGIAWSNQVKTLFYHWHQTVAHMGQMDPSNWCINRCNFHYFQLFLHGLNLDKWRWCFYNEYWRLWWHYNQFKYYSGCILGQLVGSVNKNTHE